VSSSPLVASSLMMTHIELACYQVGVAAVDRCKPCNPPAIRSAYTACQDDVTHRTSHRQAGLAAIVCYKMPNQRVSSCLWCSPSRSCPLRSRLVHCSFQQPSCLIKGSNATWVLQLPVRKPPYAGTTGAKRDHPPSNHAGHLGNALLATTSHDGLLANFMRAAHAGLLTIFVGATSARSLQDRRPPPNKCQALQSLRQRLLPGHLPTPWTVTPKSSTRSPPCQ
jgi:hypothetical protein